VSFPALDPEPPPRPLWRRALVPVAAVAVVALVVVLALTLPGSFSSSSHHPSKQRATGWPTKVPGEVIGWNTDAHTLLAMTPTGALHHPSVLASGIKDQLRVSASGFALLNGTGGHYFLLENRRLSPGPPNYPAGSFQADDVYGVSPFAAHDTAVVVGGQGLAPKPQSPVIIDLGTGDRRSLPGAPADQVAGDKTSGAWVSVAHGLPTGTDLDPQQPDSRIEYRRHGRAPVTLATAAQLARAAHLHGAAHLQLTPYPSPSGKQIAVDVASASASATGPEAVVVLTRTGRVVGQVAATNLEQLTWGGDGERLLLLQSPGRVTTWSPGSGSPAPVVTLPNSPGGWGSCVFSPFATYDICASFTDSGAVTRWALTRVSDRDLVIEPATEVPVDWSP
jgi:hypothetical protein